MEEFFRVVYTGKLKDGVASEEVVARLMETFSLPEARAQALVANGSRHTVKKDLDEKAAKRYRAALERTGMIVQIEPMLPNVENLALVPLDEVGYDEARLSALSESDADEGFNRYPRALRPPPRGGGKGDSAGAGQDAMPENLDDDPLFLAEAIPDLGDRRPGREIKGPQAVPAGRGWTWIVGGFWHFTVNPLTWILAMLTVMAISIPPAVGAHFLGLGFVETLLPSVLGTVFGGGFMFGADAQDRGGDFRLRHLFAGFGDRLWPLALLGLLFAAGNFLIGILVTGLLFFFTAGLEAGAEVPTLESSYLAVLPLWLLLVLPLLMAYYFAPALVMLDGLGPVQSMTKSLVGCLKNILPLLVFVFLALALFVVAAIPLGLGLLVLLPTLTAAAYVAYKDVFFE